MSLVQNDFTDLSIKLTKQITKKEQSEQGIFFTPQSVINKLIDIIINYNTQIKTILEPSCGSGEFLIKLYTNSKFKNSKIDGIEYNKTIFNSIIKTDINNKVRLINEDYLNYSTNKKYDLIIGNPPYYVMKKKDINKKYNEYIEGRPNIYTLFIIKSFELLNKNGIIAFVLPKNFLNCLYYNKLRSYIYNNYKIINIIDCSNNKYINTNQDTIILIIQSGLLEKKNKYVIKRNNYIIFNTEENIIKLNEYFNNSTTLNELGFKCKIGSIVWNQVKELLTNDNTKTKLIYNSNIKNGKLIDFDFKNKEKKQFIDKLGIPANIESLVINRGYGKGTYKFNHCLIDVKYPYLIENHLINISYNRNNELTKEELHNKYKIIIKSFDNKKTAEFIKLYFCNNAINITELSYILPIWI
jgi:tRNA1(Val) A37 N6-methylase TrmN6